MRCDGQWLECDDCVVRPVIRAEVLAATGQWRSIELLVDTGADRTVLSANVLESLNLATAEPQDQIGGVGGLIESVTVQTQLRLTRDDGHRVLFRSAYAACTDAESLDMSVLGRDILDLFAVIVDRSRDLLVLIRHRHEYRIELV